MTAAGSRRAARLLVVEDDKRLAKLLRQELTQEGYDVTVVHHGGEALVAAQEGDYALVILDLNLPDMDGIEVAERLQREEAPPILMLTARGDVASRVEGLYAGASDYLTKPFSLHELLARVHVRLRERRRERAPLVYGELTLDATAGSCSVAGKPVALTAQEFKLLELLLSHQGRIFSKVDLEARLYGADALPDSNTVEVFVSNVRKKLAASGASEVIRTVRGMGYVVR